MMLKSQATRGIHCNLQSSVAIRGDSHRGDAVGADFVNDAVQLGKGWSAVRSFVSPGENGDRGSF